jgi:hypothetical protein
MPWGIRNHDDFDPERQAILLVAGDKAGVAQKRSTGG